MDTKRLQLEFMSWCESKKKSPKTEEETKQLFHAFMKEKHPKEYEAAMKQQQLQKTLKAAHGIKLQYIKNLKHQCADDEELYYYKKGGSVGCGCKKKEDGGEVKIAQKGTVVQKFKNRTKAEQAKIDKQSEEDYFAGIADHTKPGISKSKREEPMQPKVTRRPKSITNIKKDSSKNVKTTIQKCGGEVVKKFKAKCGSKMKKHQLGGSLNGIPFMQKGNSAPKAEKRYKTSIKLTQNKNGRETSTITSTTFGYKGNPMYMTKPATILRIIEHGDTAFIETPEHHIFTNVQPRTAFRGILGGVPYYSEYNPKSQEGEKLSWQNYSNNRINPKEYEILKHRFNTAWNLAK